MVSQPYTKEFGDTPTFPLASPRSGMNTCVFGGNSEQQLDGWQPNLRQRHSYPSQDDIVITLVIPKLFI